MNNAAGFVHRVAAALATAMIAAFFLSTIAVELFGSAAAVATLKRLIVLPGLLILIPAIAATGASGFILARRRGGTLIAAKLRRMPAGATNLALMALNIRDGLRLGGARSFA